MKKTINEATALCILALSIGAATALGGRDKDVTRPEPQVQTPAPSSSTSGSTPGEPAASRPATGAATVHMAPAPQRTHKTDVHSVEAQVRALRARGAGEDEIYRVRAQALSAHTIAALTEREQGEAAWGQRLARFDAERARLDPTDSGALDSLRRKHFSPAEQGQLAAYTMAAPQLLQP